MRKYGGHITEGEATGLIRQVLDLKPVDARFSFSSKADKDKNGMIDRQEFNVLWNVVKGEGEVVFLLLHYKLTISSDLRMS